MDYDLDNRIIKVDVDNDDVDYRYDALGRRVIRQEGTTKTALIWWGNSECAEHKHQAGQTVIQNDIMSHPSRLNSVIARAVDGSKFKLEWYHKNYLDHVYAVSDDSGDILEHYRYTAFGEVSIYNASGNQVATTQIDNHILWNTRRRDEVTGYYMYKFRHYSAELGRWLARDPIEERGGVNLYAFVGNDPIGRRDRLGLEFSSEIVYKPLEWIEDNRGTSANTRFVEPKLTGKQIIVENESKCCARVKKAKNIDQHIITYMFTQKTGEKSGVVRGHDGWEAVLYHERRRVMAYSMLYDAYFAKNQGYGSNVTRCGTICRETPGEAKQILEAYLDRVQKTALRIAINGYIDDRKRMQFAISKDADYYDRLDPDNRLTPITGRGNLPDFGMPNQFFDFVIWSIPCDKSAEFIDPLF